MVKTSMTHPIQIIQGAQYGSEAKGAIAAQFCIDNNVDVAVRTGATNAGHTVLYHGKVVKMQQLPVGWVNPGTFLVLGAGAVVDMRILRDEIALVRSLTGENVLDRLYIDHRASIHDSVHQQRSAASDRHHLIGATGKGCSEAVMDKIKMRGMAKMLVSEQWDARDLPFEDTAKYLNRVWDEGAKIQLEGTQGTLLDLHLGPYPYVTHKQCGPAQWMMEAGLSPALPTDIVLVARTFPIRVAGNSGPLPREISWPELAREINQSLVAPMVAESAIMTFEEAVRAVTSSNWQGRVPQGSDGLDMHTWNERDRHHFRNAASEINAEALKMLAPETLAELANLFELTTVTKKLRRIGRLSIVDLRRSVMLNRPHRMVITFMNYAHPEYWGLTTVPRQSELDYVHDLEHSLGTVVSHFTRGPRGEHIIPVE